MTKDLPDIGDPAKDSDEHVYMVEISINRYRKVQTIDGEPSLEHLEALEEPWAPSVYESDSLAVAARVLRMLEGIMLRLPPLDEDALVDQDIQESLL